MSEAMGTGVVRDLDDVLREVARTPGIPPAAAFAGTSRFRVRRRIGEGAFGVVFEVEERRSGRRLALKLLKGSSASVVAGVGRFKREFRSIADVVHPNLVGLHELVSDGDRWFFTMELVDGVDLLAHVAGGTDAPRIPVDAPTLEADEDESADVRGSRSRFDEAKLRDALGQLASGIQAIHAAGKLHRDLKPSNVLVDRGGRVVILDFGLTTDITPEGSIDEAAWGGTPGYMAPEQARGLSLTPAADWYAVGCILHEALTGLLPFEGEALKVMHDKQVCDPTRPDSGVPDLDDLCFALLQRDPAARPGGIEILERFGVAPSRLAVRPTAPPRRSRPFVGRRAELAQLDDALEAARRGHPRWVHVIGAAGMGKTAMCERFLRNAQERDDVLVLRGRCYERETMPYKAADGLVEGLVRYLRSLPRAEAGALMPRDAHLLAQLFPVLQTLPALHDVPTRRAGFAEMHELRALGFRALKELLARIADKRPLAVFVDDLQWGDADSARLFLELLSPPDPPGLLFVGTSRDDEAGPLLEELLDRGHGAAIPRLTLGLESLDPEESAWLAGRLVGDDDARARRIASESAGHPLFLSMLAESGAAASAASLSQLIAERIDALAEDARRLLEIVAVAGAPVRQGLCFEAAGVDTRALAVLRSQHLVRTSGASDRDHVTTYHDRIRRAAVQAIPRAVRPALHLALARSMERAPEADPEMLSAHYLAAGERGRAGELAALAAERAVEVLAFDRAARLYRLALAESTDLDRQHELRVALAHALLDAGRGAEAGPLFLEAAHEAEPADALNLRRLAAEHLMASGDFEVGLGALEATLSAAGRPVLRSSVRVAAVTAWNVGLLKAGSTRFTERPAEHIEPSKLLAVDVLQSADRALEFYDLKRSIAYLSWRIRAALKLGEPARAAMALAAYSLLSSVRSGPTEDAMRASARAEEIARRIGDPQALGETLKYRALLHTMAGGQWRRSLEAARAAEQVLTEGCRGAMRDVRYCRKVSLYALFRLGELSELARRAPVVTREAAEHGDRVMHSCGASVGLAPALVAQGDESEALRELERVGHDALDLGCVLFFRGVGLTHVAHYAERPELALAHWDRAWPLLERAGLLAGLDLRLDSVWAYARAKIASATDDGALREAERLARMTRSVRHLAHAPLVDASIAACLSGARGDVEGTVAHLEHAEAGALESEGRALAAACRLLRGQLIGGDEGAALERRGRMELTECGVADPERWARAELPRAADSDRV